MDKTYGVGILGAGVISEAYLRLAPLFKGLEARAVADIQPAAAASRAAEFGLVAQSVDEMLANPDIDVVVNLTIPEVHFETTKSIVSAGKHAYSEKPLVLSLAEGLELKIIADAKGVKIGCAPDTFFGGSHQQARNIIDNGDVGEIRSGTCHVMSGGMEKWHPNPDFFFRPGGGPVLDIGPYYVANLINLIGPVARVTAFASAAQITRTIGSGPRKGEQVPVTTPTTIHAVLEFSNGALITLGASWDVKAHTHPNTELYGTKGSLFIPDPNFFGGQLKISNSNGEVSEVTPWEHPLSKPNQENKNGKPLANYRTVGLADLMQSVQDNRPARCSLETTLHAVDVMTSILASAEAGQAISMQTSCDRPQALGPDEARALFV